MIGVKVNGALGNQLFQFAFAFSASKKLNTCFCLLNNPDFRNQIFKYFRITTLQSKRNRIKELIFNRIFCKTHFEYSNWCLPEDNLKNLQNNSLYLGFFQSVDYFNDYSRNIKNLFRIKKEHIKEFHLKFNHLFSKYKTVAIHLRRKDYLIYGNEKLGGKGLDLPMSYYEEFLKILDTTNNYKIIFVSDDIEFVRQYFGEKNNYIFESNSPIIDLQLLIHADILCLANSSFSWWGAFLNIKKDRIVYAPAYWLGFKIKETYPKNIIPKDWRIINY